MKRILQLDGLRFLMCLIIIIGHMEFLQDSNTVGEIYWLYFHNPTLAVDYFFMLSGFGLYISNKCLVPLKRSEIFNFSVRKIKKIYPIYLVSLIISIPILFLNSSSNILKTILKVILFGGIDITLFQSITGTTAFGQSLNGVAWFLSTLFICFFACPFFLRLVDRVKSIKNAWIIALFVLFTIIGLSVCASYIDGLGLVWGLVNNLWYGHPIIRCWYLLLGMIVGFICKHSDKKIGSIHEIVVSIVAIFWFVMRNSIHLDCNYLRVIDVLICFFLLFVFANGKDGVISKFLSKKYIVKLGNDSMYFFLIHYPIRLFIHLISEKLQCISLFGEFSYAVEIFLIIVLTYLATYILKKYKQKLDCIFKLYPFSKIFNGSMSIVGVTRK